MTEEQHEIRTQHTVSAAQAGQRIDKLLTTLLTEQDATMSRARVQKIIEAVTVNAKPTKPAYRVEPGDVLDYPIPELPKPIEIVGENIPLDVVYEDAAIAAVNKPAGMVVHPALGHSSGTLVNAILGRWPETAEVGEHGRAGIVHRLDKDTSGVILVAKTEAARRSLVKQFKARRVQKRYLALVHGIPASEEGEINAPIGRDPKQRKKMAVVRDGRESVSFYKVLKNYGDVSLLEVLPRTGRTHQIRVHLMFIKTPVVGDAVYGFRRERRSRVKLKRQFLHAESLTLISPATKKEITVRAPLPDDLQRILETLERGLDEAREEQS
jgi:23S rRNA pseudouridine1911/1915/1917 synthase